MRSSPPSESCQNAIQGFDQLIGMQLDGKAVAFCGLKNSCDLLRVEGKLLAIRIYVVGKTPLENPYVSTGWGTGGYKAIPAGGDTLAYTVANDRTHELLEPFQLDRFETGRLVDEGAASGVAH